MLIKFKKLIAKVALVALAAQLVTFVAPAQVAHAAVLPVISNINYGGSDAVAPSPVTDPYLLTIDATKATATQLQTITVKSNEAATLHVSVLGNNVDVPLTGNTAGDTISLDDYLGGATKAAFDADPKLFLTTYASILGTISMTLDIDDGTNNQSYSLVIDVIDKVKPELSSIDFAGNSATLNKSTNVWSLPLYNVGDYELANSELKMVATEDSTLQVTTPIAPLPAPISFTGTTPVTGTASTLFGGTVTYAELKAEATSQGHVGYVEATATLTDTEIIPNVNNLTIDLVLDNAAPVVKAYAKPVALNSAAKELNVLVSADKPVMIDPTTNSYKVDGASYLSSKTATIDSATFSISHTMTFPADFFTGVTNKIEITFDATDKAGNITTTTVTVSFDNVAPAVVTNLVATVNDQGQVVLSWTNPAAGTYVGLEVLRDGAHLTNLGTDVTTFTDVNVVRGQSYTYTVVAYDEAGNTATAPVVQVTVPSNEVAAAVSDNQMPTDNTTAVQGTVNSGENNNTKATENKNENEFPWWGIVILVILAGVGGWLIYSQKPAPEAAPVVPPVKAGGAKKKTTPKK